MTKPTRIRLAAAVAVVAVMLALAAAYVLSPWMAFQQLRSAARAHDSAKLERLVDFPQVRDGLKAQLNAQVSAAVSAKAQNNPFAALAGLLAPAVVDGAVEAFVTPEGMSRLLDYAEMENEEAPPMAAEPAPAASGTPVAGGGDPPPNAPPAAKKTDKVRYGYDGPNRFKVISGDNGPGEEAIFLLQRQGLFGWRLTHVELPNNLLRASAVPSF